MPDNRLFYVGAAVAAITATLWVLNMLTNLIVPAFIWALIAGAILMVAGLVSELISGKSKTNVLIVEHEEDDMPDVRRAA